MRGRAQRPPARARLRHSWEASIGLPFFAYGLVVNGLPYLLPRWLARRTARKETDYATTRLLASIVAFPLFWALEIWIVWRLLGPAWALGFALSLPVSGLLAYRYLGGVGRLRNQLRFGVLSLTHRQSATPPPGGAAGPGGRARAGQGRLPGRHAGEQLLSVHRLEELSTPQLDALDRARTVVILTVSPLETHGPHLPLGVDAFTARHFSESIAERLVAARPGWSVVLAPTLHLGSFTFDSVGTVRRPPAGGPRRGGGLRLGPGPRRASATSSSPTATGARATWSRSRRRRPSCPAATASRWPPSPATSPGSSCAAVSCPGSRPGSGVP